MRSLGSARERQSLNIFMLMNPHHSREILSRGAKHSSTYVRRTFVFQAIWMDRWLLVCCSWICACVVSRESSLIARLINQIDEKGNKFFKQVKQKTKLFVCFSWRTNAVSVGVPIVKSFVNGGMIVIAVYRNYGNRLNVWQAHEDFTLGLESGFVTDTQWPLERESLKLHCTLKNGIILAWATGSPPEN